MYELSKYNVYVEQIKISAYFYISFAYNIHEVFMWSNLISIDKGYDREIGYILEKLQCTKDVSYAIEESENRVWIYLASACECVDKVESKIYEILDVVFLSFLKLRFFLERLPFRVLDHARCALLSSIVNFDRDFESGIIAKTLSSMLDYNVDGIFNFRLKALKDAWAEVADVAARLLEGSSSDADIYDIASFIAGSDGGKNQICIERNRLKNLTERKLVEIVNLFDAEEYNILSAIIKEKPCEIVIENNIFSNPMKSTLRRIARVIEKS